MFIVIDHDLILPSSSEIALRHPDLQPEKYL